MKINSVIIILVVLSFSTVLYSSTNDAKINIILRIDDYGIDSEEFYKTLFNTFKEKELPLALGVVPYRILHARSTNKDKQTIQPMSESAINILKIGLQTCNLEIGQHGYCHENVLHDNKIYSEFIGLDYNIQYDKIIKGKDLLEKTFNVKVNTFIPPWNAYDENTLKVLDDLDYKIISASCDQKDVIENPELKYIPYTVDLSQVKKAVLQAKKSESALPHIIVVLFHAYDFYENQEYYDNYYTYNDNLSNKAFIHYQEFEELLQWLKNQEDVKMTLFSELVKTNIDLGWKKFLDNRSIHKFLPAPDFVYPTYYPYSTFSDVSRNTYSIMYIVYPILFYMGLIWISMGLGYCSLQMLNMIDYKRIKIAKNIIILLFIILFIYSFRDFVLGCRALMLITIFMGLCLGYILYIVKIKALRKE